jgi:hypothetical protein
MKEYSLEMMIVVAVCLIVYGGIITADDVVKEDQVATKEEGSSHGWVYNTKTKILQFCMQTSPGEYDANAEVICIPYPKKVKPVNTYDSFFLDGGPENFDPEAQLKGIPEYNPTEK